MQIIEQRAGTRLAHGLKDVRWLTADLARDRVQHNEALQRLLGQRRAVRLGDLLIHGRGRE